MAALEWCTKLSIAIDKNGILKILKTFTGEVIEDMESYQS